MTARGWLALAALVAALAPAGASAQPDANRRALELGYEGDRMYAQGRWADAYERFAAADARAHSPVFTLYMARCRKNAGRLLEAKRIYQRVAAEALPASAPKPFHDAISDARAELSEIEGRIPSLRVQVRGARGSTAVSVDGQPIADPETPTPLDPGTHRVQATSSGQSAAKSVQLADGAGVVSVQLDLGSPAAASSTSPRSAPTGAADEASSRGSLAPAWVALSIGVVGLGVGAVTGALAAAKASDVKENCEADHCLQSDAGELDAARTLATVSTVGFIAGGVGVAAAGILFVVRPGGSSSASGNAARSTWVGVRGVF